MVLHPSGERSQTWSNCSRTKEDSTLPAAVFHRDEMLCNLIKISASLPWPSPGSAVLSSNDDCSALENAAMTTLPLHNLQNPSIKASVSTESTRLGSAPTAAGAAASILKPLWQCWGNAGVLPASATEGWICYLALAVFFPSTLIIRALGFSLHWRLVLIAAVPAVIVLSLEALHLKVSSERK